jgi:hypothetical protein
MKNPQAKPKAEPKAPKTKTAANKITTEKEAVEEPLHASLDNLPPMTALTARAFLKPLIDLPDADNRRSLSFRNSAKQAAQVLWNAIERVPDNEPIFDLYARHIWRETHLYDETKGV